MEAQQVVVMQAEANLEEEKAKSEEYLAVVRKYQERQDEMEVSVGVWIFLVSHWNFPILLDFIESVLVYFFCYFLLHKIPYFRILVNHPAIRPTLSNTFSILHLSVY